MELMDKEQFANLVLLIQKMKEDPAVQARLKKKMEEANRILGDWKEKRKLPPGFWQTRITM